MAAKHRHLLLWKGLGRHKRSDALTGFTATSIWRRSFSAASNVEGLAAQARSLLDQPASGNLSTGWHCGGREILATASNQKEVEDVCGQVTEIGGDVLADKLELEDLSYLCRVHTAAGFIPDGKLVKGAAERLRKALKQGDVSSTTLNAGAAFALSVCEAGSQSYLGAEMVNDLVAAGAVEGRDENVLGGSGAAALALAAASAGKLTTPMLSALLSRCSADEISLTSSALGDLRLATALAGETALEELDIRASNFLTSLCKSATLDDPRHTILPTEAGAFEEALTPFESELSDVLNAIEIPHSRAGFVSGMFVPLSAVNPGGAVVVGGAAAQGRLAFVAEDTAALATYSNAQSQRCAFQRWKYVAISKAGWHVFPITEVSWKNAPGLEAKMAHLKSVLAAGPFTE